MSSKGLLIFICSFFLFASVSSLPTQSLQTDGSKVLKALSKGVSQYFPNIFPEYDFSTRQWKKYLTSWPSLSTTSFLGGRTKRQLSPYLRKLYKKFRSPRFLGVGEDPTDRQLGGASELLGGLLRGLPPITERVQNTVSVVMKKPEIMTDLALTISRHLISNTVGNSFGRAPPRDSDRSSSPDFRATPALVEEAGFLSEEHPVVTEDGYVLTMHRIVNTNIKNKDKPVVFLQHGLLCSSSDWVIGDRSKAFGFILADAGYDVWLGNFRGNMYSRRHIFVDPAKEDFWKFSWDQMGAYDLPSMLTEVLRVSGQEQLVYVGHSMGTTAFWVMMNQHPHLNTIVSLMIGMAPVAAASHMFSPIKYIAPVAKEVEHMLKMTGQYEFWSRGSLFAELSGKLCDDYTNTISRNESLCSIPENIIFTIAGFDEPQMNITLLPSILAHTPAGTSSRTVLHFAQGIQSDQFQKFDFGDEEQNLLHHGSIEPPIYHLEAVTCPVALMWGENDWLAHPKDVRVIAEHLPNMVANIRVNYESWNHLDFLWGKDADTLLYHPAMQMMDEYIGRNKERKDRLGWS